MPAWLTIFQAVMTALPVVLQEISAIIAEIQKIGGTPGPEHAASLASAMQAHAYLTGAAQAILPKELK